MAELRILVGTMTGTAEAVAKDIQDVLTKAGHQVEILLMDGRDSSIFETDAATCDAYLICSSTYGSGDVPDNAQSLFSSSMASSHWATGPTARPSARAGCASTNCLAS